MQLMALAGGLSALLLLAGGASAQSLSPMRAEGQTPSDIKGFRLIVGNPYKVRMSFAVVPMDARFETAAPQAAVSAPIVRLAPGAARPVIVQFRIDPALKERTIGVCVMPTDLAGPVLPRVCGTFTGRIGRRGG